jgi:hypothetical protein
MPIINGAIFEINVGGTNVTERFNPILDKLDVVDSSGETASKASIILSDVSGRIFMPSIGDNMTIGLGWDSIVQVFEGVIDDVRSRGGSREGHQLIISGHGFDTGGKAKEPLELHKDDASLEDFMNEAAGKAGLSFQAQGKIASIQRKYWMAGTESFIHLGQRIAHEVGAVFKIQGNQAYMWPINSPFTGVGASGSSSVQAIWAPPPIGNLLEWDIAPIIARPRFSKSRARYYDHEKAEWKEESKEVSGASGDGPEYTHRLPKADVSEAEAAAEANSAMSQREAGSGHVTIVGNPAAFPEGTCNVSGVRPGVDGTYRINTSRHSLNAGHGYVTHLELKQPDGGAGTDSRG